MEWHGMDLYGWGQLQAVGSCEYSDKPSGSIKCKEFLTSWGTVSFSIVTVHCGVNCNAKCLCASPFRGDLAIALLVHYKDDPGKVARIMDKLLDREVHQLLKTPIVSTMYSTKNQVTEVTWNILNVSEKVYQILKYIC